AFALVRAASTQLVCRALHAPPVVREGTPCDRPLDLWPDFRTVELIAGRTYRAALYPDEIAGFAARAACALALALVILVVLLRRMPPVRGAEWILGALLLL